MEKRILILDEQRIDRKLQRMAYQIWEHHSHEAEVVLVGIDGTGLAVAKDLHKRLDAISSLSTKVVTLKMDKKKPLKDTVELNADLKAKSVVLIDDVADSGKTLAYALCPILSHAPKSIMIAVLVDRKHKSFPVAPDIVGHSVATTLQEHIEVVCEGEKITAAYLE